MPCYLFAASIFILMFSVLMFHSTKVFFSFRYAFVGFHDADPGMQREWLDVRGFPWEGGSVEGSTGDRCVVAEFNRTSQVSSLREEPCSTPNPYVCELETHGRSGKSRFVCVRCKHHRAFWIILTMHCGI